MREKFTKLSLFQFLKSNQLFVLISVWLIIGLSTFSQYGITWDEHYQRETALVNFDYIFNQNDKLLTYRDKDYGVAFELPLLFIEKALKLSDEKSIYTMRHLVTHLLFLLAAFFFYKLILNLYNNRLLALLGFLMLVLHPRIYTHSFFNSKDLPFLSLFIISTYFIFKSFKMQKVKYFALAGIATGLLISVRIMGILAFASVFLFLLFDFFTQKSKSKQISFLTVYAVLAFLFLLLSWPALWESPLNNFVEAFKNMSKFRWEGKVLFKGNYIKADQLSWDYFSTWFSITTPIFYLLVGVYGICLYAVNFIKKPLAFFKNQTKRSHTICIIFFFSPLLAVIILQSVLYDAWRQLFFVYPFFVLIAVYGISDLINKSRATKKVVLSMVSISFVFVAFFTIKNFPNQNVFFNELFIFSKPNYLQKNYELDYWGASFKQSIEYVVKNDLRKNIKIDVSHFPGIMNIKMIPLEERKRIEFVHHRIEADYFITNYRSFPKDLEELKPKSYYKIIVNNSTINEVFKLK